MQTDMIEPRIGRHEIIATTLAFLAGEPAGTLAAVRDALETELDLAGPDAVVRLAERLATAGADWDYYQADPLARRIHHVLADRILDPGCEVVGLDHAAQVEGKPVVIFANHLSYSDANLFEILVQRSGGESLTHRLTVVAGPKVYSSLKRRFSSLCFGTIKTPQSSTVSSEDAVMNSREVARAALRTIRVAHERLRGGDAVLVFAEGTRSRSGGLQPMLAGVTRYLDAPGVWVLPVGITGTDGMFPIGDDRIHRVRIAARIGRPFDAAVLRERADGDRRLMMDVAGLAIAAVLPPDYRGAYSDDAAGFERAREILHDLGA